MTPSSGKGSASFKPFDFGSYHVESELGHGGVGVVYRARRLDNTGPAVALKVLRDPQASQTRRLRFEREAMALARVDHPGVVKIIDAGSADERSYIAMELIAGPSLERLLEHPPENPTWALETVEQVSAALHVAHQAGIVHRDIKPSNILIGPDGKPRITDFGFAFDLSDPTRLTRSGICVGTPLYMSPEQLEGKRVDARTDVYALGVVLYELLCGDVPHHGNNPDELFRSIEDGLPPMPGTLKPGIPKGLDGVISRSLAFEPVNRHETAEDFGADLKAVRLGQQPKPTPAFSNTKGASKSGRDSGDAGSTAPQESWVTTVVTVLLAALAGGLCAALALWLLRS